MNDKLLKVEDLVVQYRTDDAPVKAINGISFNIMNGETLGLVGETGAGKTTTALSLIGLIPNPPGEILGGCIHFKGEDILKKSEKNMRKIRGAEIAMIFQDPMTSLNPVLTVGEQISEVVRLHKKISRAEATKRAVDMLEMVGIPGDRFDEYPHQFSGGMKQRVIIAIALACNPRLLIADEPTTALDVTIQAQILDLIKKLQKEFGTSMLLITHDLGIVAEVCDRVAIMYAGEIVESGTLEDIFDHTAHPYTRGLFKSIPDIDVETSRLETIPGLMPDPSDLPGGCKFHTRCTSCKDGCSKLNPSAVEIGPGHFVRCLLYQKEEE